MSDPIAVVTGGCGFIGSHMVDLLLSKGFDVRVLDNLVGGTLKNLEHVSDDPRVSIFEEDIRAVKPGHKAFKGARYVFHFAGIGDIVPSIDNPVEYMDVNVQGTVAVLEAARHASVQKLVYAASSSCYGLADTPTNEDAPIRPQYPYALSKDQGEQAVLHWNKVYKLPVNSIRIFNAYGTRSRTSGAYGAVFGVFLKQKLADVPLTIVGDGTQSRDFLYVTDVARAFLAAAETDIEGEVFNLGAGNPKSVNYLASLLDHPNTYIPKRPGEPDITFADISKIKSYLDWKPLISFEEGVERILLHIDYWRSAPLWTESKIADATKTWFKYMQEA